MRAASQTSRHVCRRGTLQISVLWMCSYVPFVLSRATEGKVGAPLLFPVRRRHGQRQVIVTIRQREAETERPVWPQADGASSDGQLRAALGCAIDNQFSIDVEPESSPLFRNGHSQWTRNQGDDSARRFRSSPGQLR